MSWNLLERFIESEHFNNDPSLSVAYLSRYAGHVGIHYVLCTKLRQFSWQEIEFFLPQLCHLLVSVDNESMALEEFIYDLCEESVSGALLTFWLFQTYLRDVASDPSSASFRTCRRIYNKAQRIVFGGAEPIKRERIRDNVLPATVFSSIVLAAAAAPFLVRHAGPLAIAQSRRPRPIEDVISDNVQTQKLGRHHTVAGNGEHHRSRRRRAQEASSEPENGKAGRVPSNSEDRSGEAKPNSADDGAGTQLKPPRQRAVLKTPILNLPDPRASSTSLPELGTPSAVATPLSSPPSTVRPVSKPELASKPEPTSRRLSFNPRSVTPSSLSRSQRIRMLRSNYFKTETQFLSSLEDISNRLVSVPKPARLSALRAELALIAQDLPAEVDIPVICPAVLEDGAAARSRHHRIVRLNPAEATSLNSAERVPFLLLVEILREDFDFDPDTEANHQILSRILVEKSNPNRRRLFDITDAARLEAEAKSTEMTQDSVFEPAAGDLATTNLLKTPSEDDASGGAPKVPLPVNGALAGKMQTQRSSSGTGTVSSMTTHSTPRTSDGGISRTNSPGPRKMTFPISGRAQGPDQPDFSALATHMRTAAQMLAQLESSSSKRPKAEVDAIKAKIIASMQSLEEQSFTDENATPTFDTIMGGSNPGALSNEPEELEESSLDPSSADPNSSSGKGSARMENDQKTGGLRRGKDRDDPSAAMFGEDWDAKKERIRRSSPYGWMKNWDVVSVIVKTGADLRQEAFACQLIQVCSKIWGDAGVPVWVRRMRILVTGESSGLIETITNGVSLHSLKRSLTLAGIAAGTNPRRRIATLKEHFINTFGEPDSEPYAAAADAFARSLAAYSILSYVLQLKDRHNGNLLIDSAGHIIHIDFGFMLSNTPGSMGFEAAPFKLTHEYVDVLGGGGAHPLWLHYKQLCKRAFQALRKDAERVVMLVELMGRGSKMPCFAAGVQQAVGALRQRFVLQMSEAEAEVYVEELIGKSVGSYYTRLYDTFQYRTQGIY